MSNNLGLDQVAENQANKEVTINTATGQLDAALTEALAVSVTSGNVTLTSTQYRRAMFFTVSGATTAGRTVTLPALKKLSVISAAAANTQSVSIIRGATTIALAPGAIITVYTDGTTDGLVLTATPPNIQQLLNGISSTQGSILYRSATSWVALAAGTAGYVLRTNGAAADPSWAAGGGGGGGGGGGPVIGARMYLASGGQVITGSTSTVITYDTIDYADAGFTCNTGAGTITVPTTGYYVVSCNTRFTTAPTNFFVQSLLINGSATGSSRGSQLNTTSQEVSNAFVTKLTAGDVISISLFAGAGVTTGSNANKSYTTFSVAMLGGGGSDQFTWAGGNSAVTGSSSAFATKGNTFELVAPITLKSVRFIVASPTNGAQFVARIVELNISTGAITAITGTAPTVTWTTGADNSMEATFTTPLHLVAGIRYAVIITWVNAASGATILPLATCASSFGGVAPTWPGLPTAGNKPNFVTLASLTPTVTDVMNLTANVGFIIQLRWTP